MKLGRRCAVVIVAMMMVFGLVACGGNTGTNDQEMKVYTMDGKFNSETVNQWRNLYLVDEDTYILELEVLNSKDATMHTVEFVMRGSYIDNGDDTITLQPGFGNGYAMDGEIKVPCTVSDDEWNGMFETMFGVNGATTFVLNEDGTYQPAQ